MNFEKLTLKSLRELCKSHGVKSYSKLRKNEIIEKLSKINKNPEEIQIHRLNYIGSKFQLLDWLEENIKEFTKIKDFNNIKVADVFSGTGIVSYHFRKYNSIIFANDSELYSSVITHAFSRSVYTQKCKDFIENSKGELIGFITKNYSPYESCERKFFETKNAMAIDFVRKKLEEVSETLDEDEYNFILASIITSADAISNVPAVYGCYLKEYKAKALKEFHLKPIHNITRKGNEDSKVFNKNVLDLNIKAEIAYLDPPYNERQYSKNYFPLGVLAMKPEEQEKLLPLKGKTGIPQNCFVSSFCQSDAEKSFEKLISNIEAKYIFLSYNSEGIVPLDNLIKLFEKHGKVKIVKKEYKRFKSFEYNSETKVNIEEYLICLKKSEINNEKLGKITEKAVCNVFKREFMSSYKYDAQTCEKLAERFEKIPQFFSFNNIKHTGNKGGRYDFSATDENGNSKFLSVKSSKQRLGKICPQVIGQAVHNTFCDYYKLPKEVTNIQIKEFIINNLKNLLKDYFDYTFDCDIFYYNELTNKCFYIKTNSKIDWTNINLSSTKNLENWNESNTIHIILDNKKPVTIGEFQIHKHRDGIKFRWAFENLLRIFKANFEINEL